MRKTVGLVTPLNAALAPLAGEIVVAFVYGSVAKKTDHAASDIDLMVLSDTLDYPRLYAALQPVEATLSRPISPNLMTLDEWRRKRRQGDGFAARIAELPKVFVIGSDDDL